MPLIHVLALVIACLFAILPTRALAKGSCKEISLHAGKAILSGQTTGSDTDFTCFQLLVEQGATLRLKMAHAQNSDMAFNISDVIDNQDDYTFLAKRDSYRVDVYNTFRASRPGPFRILASVVKPEGKGGQLTVPQVGGATAQAKSDGASYVGRWAENPEGCRNQPDAVFTTRGMEGNENSCRFDRIRGGSGRWYIAMTCHGEGTTVREKVELFVNVNTIQIKYLDRGNASQKLVRCP